MKARDTLMGALALLCLLTLAGPVPIKAQEYPPQPLVLVVPFRVNADQQTEKISTSVTDTVRGELGKSLLVVLKSDKGLSYPVSDEGLIKLAHDKGAGFVVYGSVTGLGGNFSLDFRLMNVIEEKHSPPLFAVAKGEEGLVVQSAQLAGALGQRILEGWGRLPKEKLIAYYKARPVTAPAEAPTIKEKQPLQVKETTPPEKKPPAGSRVKVGVVPFQMNVLGASADLTTSLWRGLVQELELGDQVTVVGQQTAQQFIDGSKKLDQSEEGIKNLAADMAADYLVYGSYTELGRHMSLDFRIFYNLTAAPFKVQKVFVEGTGTRTGKIKELAFQLKRRFLKGKIIVTPLEAPEPAQAKVPVPPKKKKADQEAPARQAKAAASPRPLREEKVMPAEPEKRRPSPKKGWPRSRTLVSLAPAGWPRLSKGAPGR
jgi:TolB-like protein